jgi:hypothetical protein
MDNKETAKQNTHDAILSHLSPNIWLLIVAVLVCFVIFVIFSIFDTHIQNLFYGKIKPDEGTDFPLLFIALVTFIVAAITVWVSWMIKEEAKGISENIINTNKELIREQTDRHNSVIYFNTRLPILQLMLLDGMSFADTSARARFTAEQYPRMEEVKDLPATFDNQDKYRRSAQAIVVQFINAWPSFEKFAMNLAALAEDYSKQENVLPLGKDELDELAKHFNRLGKAVKERDLVHLESEISNIKLLKEFRDLCFCLAEKNERILSFLRIAETCIWLHEQSKLKE